MKLKIYDIQPSNNGLLVDFQGVNDNGAPITDRQKINFAPNTPRDAVLAQCMDIIEADAAQPDDPADDMADLIGEAIPVPTDRHHPLYNVTNPARARSIVEGIIAEKFDAAMRGSGLIDRYGDAERDTWASQVDAAKRHQAGDTVEFIANGVYGGETPDQFAGRIIDNADSLLDPFAPVLAAKRAKTASLDTVGDDVDAIRNFYDDAVADWSVV